MDRDQLDFIAEKESLELVETTSAINGYPQNLKPALIGLDTFEQAERISKEYGLSIEVFTRRDGWELFYRTNNRAWGPLEISAEDYGDDYRSFTSSDFDGYYENEVMPLIGEFDSFEQTEDFLRKQKVIYENIEALDEDEMVLTYKGEYYDRVYIHTLYHYYDTKSTIIGLIDNN